MTASWLAFPIVLVLNVARLITPLQEAIMYAACDVIAKLLGIVLLMNTSLLVERRLRTQADEDKTRARLVESEASARSRSGRSNGAHPSSTTPRSAHGQHAQCCELIMKRLTATRSQLGADGEEILRLLNATRTQSVNGFHSAQSCCSRRLSAVSIRARRVPHASAA